MESSKMRTGTLDPPEAPPKIFRHMSPNDIASRFFTSWYTIYERVSDCQATAVGATRESKSAKILSSDADCLHIIYLWHVMGSVELRIASHTMFSEVWRNLTNASGV